MKSIEEEIKGRAQRTVEKTLDRAEKIRKREIALAQNKKEEAVEKGKAKEDKMIKAQLDSLKAQLILEYRLKEDNFRESLCSKLLRGAEQSLDNLDDNTLLESLKRLIQEGVINLDLNKARVLVNKRAYSLIMEHYEDVLSFIKNKADDFESMDVEDSIDSYGVIIASKTTGEFIDNTFKRRFERFEEEFKEEILEKME